MLKIIKWVYETGKKNERERIKRLLSQIRLENGYTIDLIQSENPPSHESMRKLEKLYEVNKQIATLIDENEEQALLEYRKFVLIDDAE